MIITRTPFRMSFVGGGSDLPSYYLNEPGRVISTTINKYMYVSVHKKFFKNILGPEKNWRFLDNDRMRSYHYCDMSKLVISSVSTLGYEAISRSSKVAIFNTFNQDNSSKSKSLQRI